MLTYTGRDSLHVEQLRERLRQMNDEKLMEFGKAAAFMCLLRTNFNSGASPSPADTTEPRVLHAVGG
jgi:hypothetical protein